LAKETRAQKFVGKVKEHRILTGTLGLLLVAVIVIAAVFASKDSSIEQLKTIYRVQSYNSTEQWYEHCLEVALECDFYFEGNEDNVPVYDASDALPDVTFTDPILSRLNGSFGSLNSNGLPTSFVFVNHETAMDIYSSYFTKYQFKPNGDAIEHEVYQGNSADYINGKCVKVYFTSWQDLDNDGNVVANVNSDSSDACVVFRTSITPEANETESCESAADACDFYFEGYENSVPTYALENTADNVGFTNQVLARDGTLIGVMNSNGLPASFVLGGSLGIQAMEDYVSAFTEYQFQA